MADKINLEEILTRGKMALDKSFRPAAIGVLKEFITQVDSSKEKVGEYVGPFVSKCIQKFDEMISTQLDKIMHDSDFQKLEGAWRGLHRLVTKTHTGPSLKIRLLNLREKELRDDLEKAVDFDQSIMFKKIYEEEYGTIGGAPYSCLVGDFSFGRSPKDVSLLEKMSGVAAAAHAPFITSAKPQMFDMDSFTKLGEPVDLAKLFESTELAKWRSFRNNDDSRYVALTLPRVMARLPYGPRTYPADDVNYIEKVDGTDNSKFCWSSSAYVLAERITDAYHKYNWTTAIRGVEGGGLTESLPSFTFTSADGDTILRSPTEITITDRREKELSDLGFLALCHCKGTDQAVFFGAQTAQLPKQFNDPESDSNAQLSARLTYLLAASRFAHYIKAIMRDKIGTFASKSNVSQFLNRWIAKYVLITDDASQTVKARYPLREARVDVLDVPGNPGAYSAIIYLRPHFQLESLTASIRLVATIPAPTEEEGGEEGGEEEGGEEEGGEEEGGEE